MLVQDGREVCVQEGHEDGGVEERETCVRSVGFWIWIASLAGALCPVLFEVARRGSSTLTAATDPAATDAISCFVTLQLLAATGVSVPGG